MVVSQTMLNLDWPKSISRFEKWYKIIFQNWGLLIRVFVNIIDYILVNQKD